MSQLNLQNFAPFCATRIDNGRFKFENSLCCFNYFILFSGTPVNRVPIMAKQTLDLFKLFKLVVEKGGLVEVGGGKFIS